MVDTCNKHEISVISKHTVKSSIKNHPTVERRHLTPFDLTSIKVKYIQYGLLYHKPITQITASAVANLFTSFSKTINLFHPLAGRLVTTNHDDGTNTISISLDFTNEGAEFIHASAPSITSTSHDQLSDLFPLNNLIGMDGHDHPLLAAQVTELADAVFVACAFNHVVADGASAWHFINTWSFFSRSDNPEETPPLVPDFKPWFIDSRPAPIRLPKNFTDPPRKYNDASSTTVRNWIFNISAEAVAALKARANEEAAGENIKVSSLQAVLAHAWKGITRARALKPEDATTLVVIVGYRGRKIDPVVPEGYFGNIANGVGIRVTAKELEEMSLGSTAVSVNKAINKRGEEDVYRWVESWCEKPVTHDADPEENNVVLMGGSNRFDIYGNDFGWGKPVAFRYGWRNKKHSGFVKIVTGREQGSVDLDVLLREGVMHALLEDEEFMAMVG